MLFKPAIYDDALLFFVVLFIFSIEDFVFLCICRGRRNGFDGAEPGVVCIRGRESQFAYMEMWVAALEVGWRGRREATKEVLLAGRRLNKELQFVCDWSGLSKKICHGNK